MPLPDVMRAQGLACVGVPLLGGKLKSWAEVKRIVVEVTLSTKDGVKALLEHRDFILDVIYNPGAEAQCALGHYALRLSFYLLVAAADRVQHLCTEPVPWNFGVSVLEILASGWPIYGLLGLLAYRLTRDGFTRGAGRSEEATDCGQLIDSFRLRYAPAVFENQDVTFSRDVESQVLAYMLGKKKMSSTETDASANTTQRCRCLFGTALPLLGHAAAVQCLARRDDLLRSQVIDLLDAADSDYLQPASNFGPQCARASVARYCQDSVADERGVSLFSLLAAGLWAAEAFMLLQRTAPAFAVHGPKPPLGGPQQHLGSDIVVSLDPNEGRFYGRGLSDFVEHVWGAGNVDGFRMESALPCADVLVVRDSLPPRPFPGALVYIDHEAGLGPGRDAGRLDELLSRYPVVYLGVLEPLAKTQCISRAGSTIAQSRRVCAKVFSGRVHSRVVLSDVAEGLAATATSTPVPQLSVVHVPFASTSFAGRHSHSPVDLATSVRPFTAKPKFLGYLAFACVDHREMLFDLLVASAARYDLGGVDALSRCSGLHSGHRRLRRNITRGNEASFLDEAVELLRPYRFALVFENKLVPGYVTEKIVNAFLAGSIPIYWGSSAVLDIFNPEAFIYASELQGAGGDNSGADPLVGLERVAAEVVRVATDPATYRRMATAPVLSNEQLQRYFSWHRSVRATAPGSIEEDLSLPRRLSDAVSSLIAPRRRLSVCLETSHDSNTEEGTTVENFGHEGRLCPVPY